MREWYKIATVALLVLCMLMGCGSKNDPSIHSPEELTASDISFFESKALKLVAARSDNLAKLENLAAREYNRRESDDKKIKDDYTADDFEYHSLSFEPNGYFAVNEAGDEMFLLIFNVRVRVDSKDTDAVVYGILEARNLKKNQAGLYADEFELGYYSLIPPNKTSVEGRPLTWEDTITALYGKTAEAFALPAM